VDIAQIAFLTLGAVILGSAFMVVTTRNLIHAALWLIVTLFGVAILYAVLEAGFLAVVQVVIYIGAIAILFIFAVMLTRKDLRDRGPQQNRGWWLSAMVALLLFGGLVWIIQGWGGFSKLAADMPPRFDAVDALGRVLVAPDGFVLPFELASVLLLAALIGAVYVAFTRQKGDR
jgi:NADH-quinone oxidoreductase subunit J